MIRELYNQGVQGTPADVGSGDKGDVVKLIKYLDNSILV